MCETFEISNQDNSRCFSFVRLCSNEIFWKSSEVYPSGVIAGDFVQWKELRERLNNWYDFSPCRNHSPHMERGIKISPCGIPFCYPSNVGNFHVNLFGVIDGAKNGLLINLFLLLLVGNKRYSASKCCIHLWATRNAYHSFRGQQHLSAGITIFYKSMTTFHKHYFLCITFWAYFSFFWTDHPQEPLHTNADALNTQKLECETNHPPISAKARVNVVGTGTVSFILCHQ